MGLAEAAHLIENQRTTMENPPSRAAARGLHGLVQDGQPLLTAAGPRKRYPKGGLHVGFSLGLARGAGQPYSSPQRSDRSGEVSTIAKDDPDRVVS
jgi:hypothetical protein